MGKHSRKLVLGSGVLGLVMALAASVAWACSPDASITLSVRSGPSGTTTIVRGERFWSSVHIRLVPARAETGPEIATVSEEDAAGFAISVTIPPTAPGIYNITATSENDRGVGKAARTFTVTGPDQGSNDPGEEEGSPGGAPPANASVADATEPAPATQDALVADQPSPGVSSGGRSPAARRTATAAVPGPRVGGERSAATANAPAPPDPPAPALPADPESSPAGALPGPSARSAYDELGSGFAKGAGHRGPDLLGPANSGASGPPVLGATLVSVGIALLLGTGIMAGTERRRRRLAAPDPG